MLAAKTKRNLFKQYGGNERNTGSTEAQIAMFTEQINAMTAHMQKSPKDFSTQRSLILIVGKRRSLLNYLTKKDITRYRKLISDLNIRK